uniref:Uncharacterized protein n=1 Tax=Eutreptiella gymnastica TaxID=73025 RepID=A0A6U8K900_9EUGL|mmetsp:Transcript_69874/g.123204  ORF Transcript_69874/g.123204 Transcript_69874/m.123204 type:complete len:101 (+) Transcript_69874:512-814(+)
MVSRRSPGLGPSGPACRSGYQEAWALRRWECPACGNPKAIPCYGGGLVHYTIEWVPQEVGHLGGIKAETEEAVLWLGVPRMTQNGAHFPSRCPPACSGNG